MAKRKYNRPDGEKFAELQAIGLSYKQIAQRYNIGVPVVAGAIRHYKKSNPDRQPFEVDFGQPLDLSGNWMVIGDIHVPTTKYEFARLVVNVAKYYNIKNLVIAGDFFNFDLFSKYDKSIVGASWRQERDAGRVLMKYYLTWFDDVRLLMGNHDRRMIKWSQGNLDESDVFGMITTSHKASYSNFGYCNITSGDEKWLVTHSTEYSVNQLTVADQLAQKNQCNVITHHEHHVAKGFDRFGRYVVVNNGGLFDESKMAYVKLDTNKRPAMINAFSALSDGVCHLYTPYKAFTDWTPILGKASLN